MHDSTPDWLQRQNAIKEPSRLLRVLGLGTSVLVVGRLEAHRTADEGERVREGGADELGDRARQGEDDVGPREHDGELELVRLDLVALGVRQMAVNVAEEGLVGAGPSAGFDTLTDTPVTRRAVGHVDADREVGRGRG